MARYNDADELYRDYCDKFEHAYEDSGEIDRVAYAISHAPTADVVEVKHGQWLPQTVSGVKAWDCSECKTIGSPQWKRCPVCEAKMDGERRNTNGTGEA